MNNFKWKVLNSSSKFKARTGIINTPHGDIKTPAFIFCATKAALKSISVEDAEKCKLPTFPNTKPVKASDLAMFSSEKLKSDSCDYTVKCVYDEIEVDSAPPFIAAVAETKLEYWFHLTPEKEKIPFYFTFDALNPNLLADGSSHSSENFYGHW